MVRTAMDEQFGHSALISDAMSLEEVAMGPVHVSGTGKLGRFCGEWLSQFSGANRCVDLRRKRMRRTA
jgi:hypothetical protein